MALTKVKASNITLSTPAANSNDTTPATTQYVTTAINNLIDGAPATLNTLDEIAAALNDDAALNTTLTNAIAAKLPLAGGSLTGNLLMRNGGNIELGGYNSGNDKGLILSPQDGSGYWHVYNTAGGHLAFGASNTIGSSEKMRIDGSGNVGIGNSGTFNGTGTRKVQIETSASSSLGPELLIHNAGQGSGALAALTFGGKRSGNEGYTASIHTTNNDGLHFGTIAATDFSALPTTRMVIDTTGNVGIGTTSPGTAKLNVTAGSSASTIVKFGSHYDTTLQMQATATASASIQYLNAAGTGVVAMGYRDAGSGTDGAWRVRHAATLDTAGPYLNMATNGAVSISTDTSTAPVVNSHAQLELITTTNANPAHAVLAFASGVGRLGVIEAQQRAGGASGYGHISIITNAGASGSNPMVRSITANYTGKVGVGKGHSTTPDMNLEVYAYNETSQWTSSGSYHGGTQAFGILSNSPPGVVAGDYGYYKDFWYYMKGNTSHTMIWDNSDSYFNAEVQIVAACTNGGSNNNVYARGFWTNNHTAHNFAVIEGMSQTSASVGSVIVNSAAGGIGALANGNTFVFTAGQGTNASASGKLTLVHSYPGGSFYGAKIRLRVFFGQFNGHSSTS